MASLLAVASKFVRGKSQKAHLEIEGMPGVPINFQFNPEQYCIRESGHYESIERKQGDKPIMEFIGGVNATLNLTLYFDTSASLDTKLSVKKATDVSKITKILSALVSVDGDLHRPPSVQFIWGSLHFTAFIVSVATTYTMFSENGMPVRAKADVVFKEVPGTEDGRFDPLQSPDRTKSRVVTEDSNIWNIANKEYDDISKWKIIAKANGIMNPFDVPVGTTIKVPALTDL